MSLKQQIEVVKQEIDNLEKELNVKQQVLSYLQAAVTKRKTKRSGKKSGPPKKGSIAAHVLEVLKSSDKPKTVDQLVQALKDRGVENGSKTGLNILIPSAIARRDDLFARVGRGVYNLKSRVEETEEK